MDKPRIINPHTQKPMMPTTPNLYGFQPQKDITVTELAEVVAGISRVMGMALTDEAMDMMTPEMKRHFILIGGPKMDSPIGTEAAANELLRSDRIGQ